MLTYNWSGKFSKGTDRKTFTLKFEAEDNDAALKVISDYVALKIEQGFNLVENQIHSIRGAKCPTGPDSRSNGG